MENKSRLLDYHMLHNIRDLGGMKTVDGRMIVSGKLIRSEHLSEADENDRMKLEKLLDTVVDFRDEVERLERPDPVLPEVAYYHIPVLDKQTAGITREEGSQREVFARLMTKPKEMKQLISGLYTGFALDEKVVMKYTGFIHILLKNHEKAVLWHCTAGKDRAGIAAVIIEEILGISRDVIIEDYLRTNEYLTEDFKRISQMLKQGAKVDQVPTDEALQYMLGAERDYIETFYSAVDGQFGGFDGFLKDGLKLTEAEIATLQRMYLTDAV